MAGVLLIMPGCGEAETEEPSASIALIEPVSTSVNTELAAYRDFYDYKVVTGTIYPEVKEYSFSQDVVLMEYAKAPGDKVSKGSVLAYADDTSIQNEIENLEEKIEQLTENYNDAETALQKEIKEEQEERARQAEKERQQKEKEAAEEQESTEEEEIEQDEALLEAIKKAKEEQEAAANKAAEMQRIQQNYTDRSRELSKAHRTELYQMDLAYYNARLETARNKQKEYQLVSGMSGTVVSVGKNIPGTYVSVETPIVAVADDTKKILKCEYVSKTDVAKCEDIYALINGKRYEVTYQPYEQGAYEKITEEGNVAYASFLVDDPNDEVKQGAFAVLAEVYSRKEHVLSVPKSAVQEDASGAYVYCLENGKNQYTKVKTGEDDGTYVEITEGLKEGDAVLLTEYSNIGTKTATVTRGDFYSEFEGTGFIDFPMSDYITNPIEYGTAYFTEYQVEPFQSVKAGDVIAKIHVKSDSADILEKQLKLQRLQERLQDAVNENEEENVIVRQQEEIQELQELLTEMQKDSSTTEIKANKDGIVFWLADYSVEDAIEKDAPIAVLDKGGQCFLTVRNENQQLNYGNTVSIEYTDQNMEEKVVEGKVVTLGAAGFSAELKSEEAYISIPKEVSDYIKERMTSGNFMELFQRPPFTVKTEIRSMAEVLLIPKKAVYNHNGKTYVYVKNDDGTITAQSFIAGGSNETDYWVLEGLEEGMTICLE